MKTRALTPLITGSSSVQAMDALQAFADAMPILVWIANPQGIVVYHNQKLIDYAPATTEEDGTWKWETLIHCAHLESSLSSWKECVIRHKPYEQEHLLRMADGSYHWHVTRAVPKRDDENNVLCWYGTALNIHAQRTSVNRLDERTARVRPEMPSTCIEGLTDALANPGRSVTERNDAITLGKYNKHFLREFSQRFSSYDNPHGFFNSLVKWIHEMTKLDYVLVGKAVTGSDGKFSINTLAITSSGELVPNIVYPMWKGPCYEVVKGTVYSYPRKCRQTFPENKTLVELKVEGYVGYPLYDRNSNAAGLIAVMHEKEIENAETIASILRIVAKRAEFELDRIDYENALKQRNVELQLSSNRLQSTIDGVPAMIALLDVVNDDLGHPVDFVIWAANKATADFAGCQPAQLIGKRMSAVSPESFPDRLLDSYLEVFSTGNPLQEELFNPILKKWFSILVTKQVDGNGVVSFVLEITEQKKAEEERKQNVLLTDLDRAKTAFFSNVSHEFRTPLTLLLGPVEDILNNRSIPKFERAKLEMVQRNALRLQKLVNSLLDFSRVEAGRFETVFQSTEISGFTKLIAANFRSVIEKAGLKFTVECDPTEHVYLNRDMWEKIVLNLISNAFKFTLKGGIRITIKSLKNYVELHVSDTGNGIPGESLSRIFQRFVRIENNKARTYEGSGIGLALVQELVSMHGGIIKVKSKVGEGSEFIVSIRKGKKHIPPHMIHEVCDNEYVSPQSKCYWEEVAGWLPVSEMNTATLDQKNINPVILLVDDNTDLRAYIRGVLKCSYDIIEASNGSTAMELLNKGLKPGLILSDIMMPEMNGFEFLRAVRNNASTVDVPFIFLSAKASEEERVVGIRAGADYYLIKPFSAKELFSIVKSKIEKSNKSS